MAATAEELEGAKLVVTNVKGGGSLLRSRSKVTGNGTIIGTGIRRRVRLCSLTVAILALAAGPSVRAHPISLTSGQAVVGKDGVRVKLDVLAEDFMMFYGLTPNEANRISSDDLRVAVEQHRAFLLRDFSIRDVDGGRLQGRVVKMIPPVLADDGIAVDELMDHAFTYYLEFPLDTPPTHLTFSQSFGSADIPLPAILELEVIQQGITTPDAVVLSNEGNVETFDFDWKQPGEAGGETPQQRWERRRQQRREQRLGIGSYGGVYVFIYIQDRDVRIETLIPLLTLETWVELERRDPEFLEVEEQQAAEETIERFLSRRNVVKIDGIEVKPTLQRLDFYGVDFRDFAMRPPARRLSALTARVGVILSYSTKGGPRNVDIHWRLFNAAVYTARAAVYTSNQTLQHKFTAYKPRFSWTSPGTEPLPEITRVDAANGTRVQAESMVREIVPALVRNVYRAFDYREERDIYDALARSVHGDLLTELYLQIRKSLIMQEQGGAISRVKDVRIADGAVKKNRRGGSGTTVWLQWTVDGTVEHWGHIHTRVNQYEADFTVRPVDKAWKIVEMELLNQQRLKYQVNVRRF